MKLTDIAGEILMYDPNLTGVGNGDLHQMAMVQDITDLRELDYSLFKSVSAGIRKWL